LYHSDTFNRNTMKGTDTFKKTIEARLQEMAAADPLFAANMKKEGKNLDDCITYILNQVKNSGCVGFTDDEIFGMAAHYYDEDKIEVGKPFDRGSVVGNHKVELSQEELEQAKKEARERVMEDEKARLWKKQAPAKKPENTKVEQPSLF